MPTQLTINEQALIPAIAQDAQTGAVLMVAHMNHEALTRTIESSPGVVLQSLPTGALAQGRDIRQHPKRRRDPPRL